MSAPPPSSQKSDVRPISFIIWDRAEGLAPIETVLFIRPEELTRSDTSRTVVQQTLGNDPWVDSFGGGLPMITISGHTGWKPGAGASYLADATISAKDDPKVQAAVIQSGSAQSDGLARMLDLKNTVYTQWHARRAAAIDAGKDPDLVTLIFLDVLNGFSLRVAPLNFTLRRSRSRPLLAQYQIQLQGIQSDIKKKPWAKKTPAAAAQKTALGSMLDSIGKITSFINGIKSWVDKNLLGPVTAFLKMTQQLFNAVKGVITAIDSVAASLISVARTVAQAGANLFRALAMVKSLPSLVKQRLMEVGSAFVNIFCVLKNAVNQQQYTQDFSGILGSSGCSSTAGGAPVSAFANANTFAAIAPPPAPLPVSATPAALAGLQTLVAADHINAPLSTSAISTAVTAVANGMKVSA